MGALEGSSSESHKRRWHQGVEWMKSREACPNIGGYTMGGKTKGLSSPATSQLAPPRSSPLAVRSMTTFDFCLSITTRFYNKHIRSCLASRRSVSGWRLVTHGAMALQPNELESSGRFPREGGVLPQSGEPAPPFVPQEREREDRGLCIIQVASFGLHFGPSVSADFCSWTSSELVAPLHQTR